MDGIEVARQVLTDLSSFVPRTVNLKFATQWGRISPHVVSQMSCFSGESDGDWGHNERHIAPGGESKLIFHGVFGFHFVPVAQNERAAKNPGRFHPLKRSSTLPHLYKALRNFGQFHFLRPNQHTRFGGQIPGSDPVVTLSAVDVNSDV
jgi:hypothetical protein